MCGILGIVSAVKIEMPDVNRMVLSLAHRGPDAQGACSNPQQTIALGHTRLSIIDLSTAANQPFYSNDGRYVIAYNGEVYNFQQLRRELIDKHGISFRTSSDTEVIVEAFGVWGAKMAAKLHGMFAIAIADYQEQKLFLIRDRLGKKPLYYFQSDSIFVFASEIKALLKNPVVTQSAKLDRRVISSFLHLGYIPEPNTIYTAIKKFPAAHVGEIDMDLILRVSQYWSLEGDMKLGRMTTSSNTKGEFQSLLDNAVQKRLVSDVPLGAFLSGGTDSSLVTALATHHVSKPFRTFTIGFKESKYDESGFARQVAAHLKTDHTEYILSEKEVVDLMDTYLEHFDEPFADTSAIPTMLVSKLARKEVKVVLTGDGGDELFQGYGAYAWASRLDNPMWKLFKRPLQTALLMSRKSNLQRIAHMLSPVAIGSVRSHIFSQEQYFFSQHEIQQSLLNKIDDFVPFEYDESYLLEKDVSPREKQAIFDLKFYLKDDLLAKVDRASMYYGLECRCPLLDDEIVRFALNAPMSDKKRGDVHKWILKDILKDHLPKHLVNRPKWGFSIPLAQWLKNDLNYLMDYLSTEQLERTGVFNPVFIRTLVDRFYNGQDYLYNRLWVVIIMQKFLIQHI